MRLKRFLSLAIKILLTIIISFFFFELLLLIFNDYVFRNSFFVYDPDMGYKVRPYAPWGDSDIANEFGFNDRDYPHERTPGTYRILIIGDSYNWAGGMDGNYTAILERKFASEFGEQRVEVINAGYAGTHTGEQLEMLKKYGLQYNPDLVVLGFFAGNDYFDADPTRRRIAVGTALVDINRQTDWEINLFGQLVRPQSRLYAFLKERWATYQYLQNQQQSVEAETQIQPTTDEVIQSEPTPIFTEHYLTVEVLRMQMANWEMASDFQPRIDYINGKILTMRDLLTEKDIQFIVAAYPDEFQVDTALQQAAIDYFHFDPAKYQWNRAQGLLWQFCTEHQIEYYDMLPVFQEAHQQGQQLYLPNDSHWNEAGNELAAQYLFDVLVWKAREFFTP